MLETVIICLMQTAMKTNIINLLNTYFIKQLNSFKNIIERIFEIFE